MSRLSSKGVLSMEERYQQTQINYYRLSSSNFYVAKATFLSV